MSKSNKLAGLNFVVTGKCSVPRNDLHALIEENGGVVQKGVSKNTQYLIVGMDVGAVKMNKAEALGVKLIEEEVFRDMIK